MSEVETMKRKYNNSKIEYQGRVFDSKAECELYQELALKEQQGMISNLECQPKYTLVPKFRIGGKMQREMTYTPDFQYYDNELKINRVLDLKGFMQKEARDRHKLFNYLYLQEFPKGLEVVYKYKGKFVSESEYKSLRKAKKKGSV